MDLRDNETGRQMYVLYKTNPEEAATSASIIKGQEA